MQSLALAHISAQEVSFWLFMELIMWWFNILY